MSVFALLDDAAASSPSTASAAAESPARSRLYSGFVREHRCVDPVTLDTVCAAARADLDSGLHAVLVADYEWGAKLQRAGHAALAADDASCLRLLMFSALQRLQAGEVAQWLADAQGTPEPGRAGLAALQPGITRTEFDDGIARIHEAIRAGETYQVNFTYRITGQAWGEPLALYRRLRARQRVGFGALMRLPMRPGDTTEWVLSRSPELFVSHQDGELRARPMKGTAVRALPPEGDSETARLLHEDIKNRAENLMIVDLLRNDLGRIAQLGSVKVPELFAIEPYATVFQMTSSVHALRRPDVGLADLLRAVYPCGSITGAPKHHTMDLIAELESTPRGLYTGSIGWLDATPPGSTHTCPNLCLSVAIRTLTLGAESNGMRPMSVGVGGGIVLDSVAADEFEETRWKARFFTALDPGIELFETLLVTPDRQVPHLDRHRARLQGSAHWLGLAMDDATFDSVIAQALQAVAAQEPSAAGWRLRVSLDAVQGLQFKLVPLDMLPPGPVHLRIEPRALPASALSAHKTSAREAYDEGIRAAQALGAFDSLFFGEHGRLIEGGRTTVFARIDGEWRTPPLADGALPGVMRAVLLADATMAAREHPISREELMRASHVIVCNALRGALPATIDWTTNA